MVKAKKYLGQHFLKDESIAQEIVNGLVVSDPNSMILEIGPGTGVLSKYLFSKFKKRLILIDLDKESIDYLKNIYPEHEQNIVFGDFLKHELAFIHSEKFQIIGNFPYNISSQIFFRILEMRNRVNTVVCMLQYEVAKRLCSGPDNKSYGILSVILQAYYDLEYLFDVEPHVFDPPPKVRSGVIRLTRNKTFELDCSHELFKKIVKQGFQNRRKTLRNALKPLNLPIELNHLAILNQRAEALSVNDFVSLTKEVEQWKK